MLKIIFNFFTHPLANKNIIKSFSRFFRWQIASRLLKESYFIMPFFSNSKLLMKRGMTGATGNWYFGLHEINEMSFLLKALKKEDLFIDIGANIGSYTILASKVVGSNVLCFEPVLETFSILNENIHINHVSDHVKAFNIGLSNEVGEIYFTNNLDTTNHVSFDNSIKENCSKVKIDKLDNFIITHQNIIIKIDVEGFEIPVLLGADNLFQQNNIIAVIIETNSSGLNYGYSDSDIFDFFYSHNFKSYKYNALSNKLIESDISNNNTIFIKSLENIKNRINLSTINIF